MKVLEYGKVKNDSVRECICSQCESKLEVERKDIVKISDYYNYQDEVRRQRKGYVCPVCNSENEVVNWC